MDDDIPVAWTVTSPRKKKKRKNKEHSAEPEEEISKLDLSINESMEDDIPVAFTETSPKKKKKRKNKEHSAEPEEKSSKLDLSINGDDPDSVEDESKVNKKRPLQTESMDDDIPVETSPRKKKKRKKEEHSEVPKGKLSKLELNMNSDDSDFVADKSKKKHMQTESMEDDVPVASTVTDPTKKKERKKKEQKPKKPKAKGKNIQTHKLPGLDKLEKEYLENHPEPCEVINRYLSPQNRQIMKNNWNAFFKAHPHPNPRMLIRLHQLEDEAKEEAVSFIEENQFYKELVKGIDDSPRIIHRTAVRCYDVRANRPALKERQYLTPENRQKLQENWNAFFKEHPHPDPAILLRLNDLKDEAREEAESFVEVHQFNEKLAMGIDDDQKKIHATALRAFKPKAHLDWIFSSPPTEPPLPSSEPPTLSEVLRVSQRDTPVLELLRGRYTVQDCVWIYRATLKQAQSTLWHKHRLGRITASRMHRIYNFMSSGLDEPTPSLLRDTLKCMSPDSCGDSWGEVNEQRAVREYVEKMSRSHQDLQVLPCGLWVNPDTLKSWTPAENELLAKYVFEAMKSEEGKKTSPFPKIAKSIPNATSGSCRKHWEDVVCWQYDAKGNKREEAFSTDDAVKLIEGMYKQKAETIDDVSWKKISKTLDGSSRKDLKYFWRCLSRKLCKNTKKDFPDLVNYLYKIRVKDRLRIDNHLTKLEMYKNRLQARVTKLESQLKTAKTRLAATQKQLQKKQAQINRISKAGPEPDSVPSNTTDSVSDDMPVETADSD